VLLFAGLSAFHALGLFSVGLLMGEGRLQCVLLGAATLLLLLAVLSAALRARSFTAAAAIAQRVSTAEGQNDADGRQRWGEATSTGINAAYWSSWRPLVTAGAAAVLMLACNVLLQPMGLIDRAGQDPHDKSQPSGELLVGSDAAWQQVLLLCFTVVPLVCIWLLVSGWSAWMGGYCSQEHAAVSGEWKCTVLGVLVWAVKWLCSLQFVVLGVFWVVQLSGHNSLTAAAVAELASVQLQQTVTSMEVLGKACAWLLTCFSSVTELSTMQHVLQAAVSHLHLNAVMQLPLRLLLPRIVYASAVASFCGTAVALCFLASCNMLRKPSTAKSLRQAGSSSRLQPSAVGYQLCVWLSASFSAALVMVLGYKGPATMLAALLQAGCCCVLLRLHAAANRIVQSSVNCTDAQQQPASSSLQSVVGGGMWGMMGLQLFFCSSHFCEFSGLQYASAFIGFDSMVWYTSGSLLLLNTCGFLLLAVLSLPAFVVACTAADNAQQEQQSTEHVRQQLACSMLVGNSMRFAALVVCMVSAAVQQQHILLWAIFAPKLCFELWFMVVTDVGQLLASALANVVL
jgi:hypothetical protein